MRPMPTSLFQRLFSADAPLPNWRVPAGRALEAALNRAILLDDDTRAALPALDGRTVALTLASPPLALKVRVDGDRLRVGPVDDADRADLSVRSTLGGLLSQLPPFRREGATPVGQLRIEGDADFARRLQRLAERFDPDWGRPFAAVFGDVLGMQVANAFGAALRQSKVMADGLARDTADWLTEESRDVVAKAELQAFHGDVDHLREAGDRLAARIARLHGGRP